MSDSLIILPECIAARGIDHATYSALANSLYAGASPESIALVYDYCIARKLDPLKKPAHIVPMNVKDVKTGRYEWRDVIMPGIGELRITAQRTGAFAGQDEPVYGDVVTLNIGGDKINAPEWCSVTIYRIIAGQRCAITHREYFEESCGTTKDGKLNSMWSKRKRGQLAKCAEAGALRKAFPEESGGIITADEVSGEEPQLRNVTPSIARETPINPASLLTVETETTDSPAIEANEKTPTDDAPTPKERDGYVVDAIRKQGEKDGKPWVKYDVKLSNGETIIDAVTFSKTIGEAAMNLKGENVKVTLEKSPKGFTLTGIRHDEEGGGW